jgi:GNAT superfamily N-acetyltransferase
VNEFPRNGKQWQSSDRLQQPLTAMHLRLATLHDVPRISALIRSLSAPFFLSPSGQGAELFLQSISESAIQDYVSAADFCYQVAEFDTELAGVVAMRDNSHLYHLFVAAAFQDQGIARHLWESAKARAVRAGNPGRFTVNASLGAVAVYERFGFVATGPAVAKHGISFQPMLLVENGGQAE